ncbi:protocatechuate 3,4-dioxygenase [Rhodospirillales bacterium]|nr:protocatechuate 3,4-dioxygenase [Rhodospirillales bacterium]
MTIQTRRNFLSKLLFLSASFLGLYSLAKSSNARSLPTPSHTEGPFYPVNKPIDQDADLTFVNNNKELAQGDIHILQGRVLDTNEKPISNALVEIWQANKWGRYQDPRDDSNLRWDKNFQGYGKVTTNVDGNYRFRTIRPSGYNYNGIKRTPHIHFKVTDGTKNIFTTQMYFAGEIENEQDMFLKNIKRKSSVIVEFGTLPNNEKIGTFDIIVG